MRTTQVRLEIPPPRSQPERPGHDEIARLAYSYWESGGRREGTALENWLRAERELTARRG